MKMYSVDEAFDLLKINKITTNKESVRRWLRQGAIKGIAPASRKEGWKIPENILQEFIQQRLPEIYITNVVKETNEINTKNVVNVEIKEQIRTEMWQELAKKYIWEGYIYVKKSLIRKCIQHRRYSKALEEKVWKACEANSKAYRKPRISYLLEAFAFEGKRLLMDKNFESLEEQIIFPVIEYIRKK
ncbi:helix-turn-helix domain-containing protein [Bacillus sp. ISL-7]|uniref:helix-turn-helix domain-containing protein n=1 Tax=Bacillus sp. ISL-7 TaxID=2819136 RepID=UPI001BE7F087|nr:helix-turn-helix domain-containing protein [Bacillus sp. ISL-7]MBT2736612.1 helix-turn-helix domain-containing protein [Bacillus sp. ISL-7]